MKITAGVRATTKSACLALLEFAGLMRLLESLSSHKLIVLTYHRVVNREACAGEVRPPNTVFADEFDLQMDAVSRRYNVLDRSGLHAALVDRCGIPRNSLAITFDDGYENNYNVAFPILQKYGFHAAFFLTTDLIGGNGRRLWFDRLDRLFKVASNAEICATLLRLNPESSVGHHAGVRRYFKSLSTSRQSEILDTLEQTYADGLQDRSTDRTFYNLMDWQQARDLFERGMTIGSHTTSHQILSAVPAKSAQVEVERSRNAVEERTGDRCLMFAYPNGQADDFRPEDEVRLQRAGYTCAFTQIPGVIDAQTSRFRLPRIPIPDVGDLRVFRSYVSGLQRLLRA
jgi:peptidoglycan/xylan/chitin deacetylase (PgdA/CDA1 family)